MKIMDEKGRLFGIINIIDLCVLLIIIVLAVFIGSKGLKNSVAGTSYSTKDIIVSVLCRLSPEEAAKAMRNGDNIVSGSAYVGNATIDSVQYTAADYSVVTADGRMLLIKHPVWKDIRVKIRLKADPNVPVLRIGTQEVRIGYRYSVQTKKAQLEGVVENIEVE